MQKKIQDFLKEANNGRIYNAQQVVAKALGIDATSVSKWCTGKTKPSEENIMKMAKVFKKSPEEIEKIFVSNSGIISSGNSKNNINSNNNQDNSKLELLDEKIKRLELEIDLLKRDNEVFKNKIKLLEDKIKLLESKRK